MDESIDNLHTRLKKPKTRSQEMLEELSLADDRLMDLRNLLGLEYWPKDGSAVTAINEVIDRVCTILKPNFGK